MVYGQFTGVEFEELHADIVVFLPTGLRGDQLRAGSIEQDLPIPGHVEDDVVGPTHRPLPAAFNHGRTPPSPC